MSYNKIHLIGFAGKDAQIYDFPDGSRVASFTLATTERGYTTASGATVPEQTQWHNIVCRGNSCSFAEKHVKKGAGLSVEGKLKYRRYTTASGTEITVAEIYAEKVEFFSFGRKER